MIIARTPAVDPGMSEFKRYDLLQGGAYNRARTAVQATRTAWLYSDGEGPAKAAFTASLLHMCYLHAVLEQYGAPEMWVVDSDPVEIINDAPFAVVHNNGRETIPEYQGAPTELIGIDINGDFTTTEDHRA